MSTELKPKIIEFKKVSEKDGCLTVAELGKELPFTIKRVFWISDVPEGMERANHACRNSDSVLICIKGQLKVVLNTGEENYEYLLDSSEKGILVPRLVWMKISEFSRDAVLLVLSSEKYFAEEYCEDYEMFIKEKDRRNEEGKMSKKPILVVSPSMPPFEEYVEEIKSLWETKHLTHTGPKHIKLQAELEKYLGTKHVSLFANGHLALELGIQALGLTGEVITTPFTFGSTTQAILRCGLTPVFCDINPEDYTIDADKIEELITDKTSAILPVHVYGNICDVEKIDAIAKKYNLKVLYDAAHAFGEIYNGINVANLGDMSMFSFHATKVFNTVEGGCLTFDDDSKVELLNGLKQFGQILHTDKVPYIGTNAKMTEVHAAMGLCNLRHIDEYLEKRGVVVKHYRERLSDIDGIRLCKPQKNVKSNYAYFPVVFEPEILGVTRDDISDKLAENNIFSRKYFYPLTSDFECCQEKGIKANVPIAKCIADNVLTLPCYSDLSCDSVDEICDIILSQIKR